MEKYEVAANSMRPVFNGIGSAPGLRHSSSMNVKILDLTFLHL